MQSRPVVRRYAPCIRLAVRNRSDTRIWLALSIHALAWDRLASIHPLRATGLPSVPVPFCAMAAKII